jgi:hypothetical protein
MYFQRGGKQPYTFGAALRIIIKKYQLCIGIKQFALWRDADALFNFLY